MLRRELESQLSNRGFHRCDQFGFLGHIDQVRIVLRGIFARKLSEMKNLVYNFRIVLQWLYLKLWLNGVMSFLNLGDLIKFRYKRSIFQIYGLIKIRALHQNLIELF